MWKFVIFVIGSTVIVAGESNNQTVTFKRRK